MGYRSLIRSIESSARKSERDSIRRQNELERRRKAYEKMEENDKAAFEVEEYESKVEQLITMHQDCCEKVNWKKVVEKEPMIKPIYSSENENAAKKILADYKPTILEKMLKKKYEFHIKELNDNILTGIKNDEDNYASKMENYSRESIEHLKLVELAKKVLNGDKAGYIEAIKEFDPFSELSNLGSSLKFSIKDEKNVNVEILVKGDQAIPKQVKSLLKSGKLSIKDMPIGKFNELYQDYVCSAILRVGRETFSLLPINSIIITAKAKMLDSSTGKLIEQPVLSALFQRETFDQIDFLKIDPSDAMKNFKHSMGFKKTIGLSPVEPLSW